MTNQPLPKRYATSTVVAVAGCSPVTFRAWRNRNGLFPETRGGEGWNYFSRADIAAVRVVVILTGMGLAAQVAVEVAMQLVPHLESLMGTEGAVLTADTVAIVDYDEEEHKHSVILVNSSMTFDALGRTIAFGTGIVVDLVEIILNVSENLRALDPEMYASGRETLYSALTAAADALRDSAARDEGEDPE